MAPKLISYDEEARRALERGMDMLANAEVVEQIHTMVESGAGSGEE